jgi:asparagine synthetase B (glutamine-hydrolysing)
MSVIAGVIDSSAERRSKKLAKLQASLLKQGFTKPILLRAENAEFIWCDSTHQPNQDERLWQSEDGFVALVGVLCYRNLMGREALKRLWSDYAGPGTLDPMLLSGNFQIAISKFGKGHLFGDPVGMIKLYEANDHQCFSTSWLACVASVDNPTLNHLGAQEYVVLSANYGLRTPVAEVNVFDARLTLSFQNSSTQLIYPASIWEGGKTFPSMEDAAQHCAAVLREKFTAVCKHYPGTLVNALSGGFDSRLILAGLIDQKRQPFQYVFGPVDSDDVQVAKHISNDFGLQIEHINKSETNQQRAPLTRQFVEQSFHFFDGIPSDGVLDRGSDQFTRTRYGSLGGMLLNGGAGEILRNYILLHDKSFTALDVVNTFYSNFHHGILKSKQTFANYQATLAKDMETQLEMSGVMPRKFTEMAYPLFRSRYWLARNNSVANRVGYYWTILLEPELIRQSLNYPLAWKDYGRLEARVIAIMQPKLAAYNSAYGFDFASGPSTSYCANQWFQYRRTPWIRGNSANIKYALGRLKSVTPSEEKRQLFGKTLAMSEVVDTQFVTSQDQWDRILTLEFMIETFGVKV